MAAVGDVPLEWYKDEDHIGCVGLWSGLICADEMACALVVCFESGYKD